jgi:DNA-binding transcriptional ArsR family regulator
VPERDETGDQPPILPGDVPVAPPELPLQLVVRSEEQIKAAFDPIRGRVLQLLRDRAATAKQLADELGVAPSLMTYHLHVLEDAGLIRLVAQRLVHGIVARYYARTARIFVLRPAPEVTGIPPVQLHLFDRAHDELLETLPGLADGDLLSAWFPHMRLSPERMAHYNDRLTGLVYDFLSEAPDPEGRVYALFATTFLAPPSLQASPPTHRPAAGGSDEHSPPPRPDGA